LKLNLDTLKQPPDNGRDLKTWEQVSLRDIVKLKNGTSFKADDWRTSGFPIIRIQNLKDVEAPFNYFQGDLGKTVVVESGDLLFSWSGSRGTSFGPHIWRGPKGVLNQHIFKVLPKPSAFVDKEYLYFALLHLTAAIEEKSYGLAALVHVRKGDLESTRVPLPHLAEQKAIAHVLRTVQQAKEATEKVIAATRQLKQSLMKHLFTYGPVPFDQADKVALKETEIGAIPHHWEMTSLLRVLREPLRNGHSARATNNGTGIRTLTLTAVTQNDFSIDNTKLTSADPQRVKDMWLKTGDILVERANTPDYVGLAALYEGDGDYAIFPDLMVRVRVDENRVLPKYLAEFLVTPVSRQYFRKNAKATAGNFPKIDQGIIENTLIPVPPMTDQELIANAFSHCDAKLKTENIRRESLLAVFNSLLHHLMTGTVRMPLEAVNL
jgi:type I restriction enzyme S subunit